MWGDDCREPEGATDTWETVAGWEQMELGLGWYCGGAKKWTNSGYKVI